MERAHEPIATEVWPPQPETDETMQFESVSVQQRGDTLQISIPEPGLSECLGVLMRTLLWPMAIVAVGIVMRFVFSRHPVTVNSALIGAVPVPAIIWVHSAITEFRSRRWKASRRVRILRDNGIYIDGAGIDGLIATIYWIPVVRRGRRYLVILERGGVLNPPNVYWTLKNKNAALQLGQAVADFLSVPVYTMLSDE